METLDHRGLYANVTVWTLFALIFFPLLWAFVIWPLWDAFGVAPLESTRVVTSVATTAAAVTLGVLALWLWHGSFRFEVGTNALRLDQGILSLESRSVPYERVEDVEVRQELLERAFDVAELRVETDMRDAVNKPIAYTIPSLRLDHALAVREAILAQVHGKPMPEAPKQAKKTSEAPVEKPFTEEKAQTGKDKPESKA